MFVTNYKLLTGEINEREQRDALWVYLKTQRSDGVWSLKPGSLELNNNTRYSTEDTLVVECMWKVGKCYPKNFWNKQSVGK